VSAIRLCAYDDLPAGVATRFDIDGHRICVVRIVDDLYAIGDTCSHAEVSLAEGSLFEEDCEIECWKHGATFSLTTGEPQSFPATQPVPVYAIRREGADVMVVLP
jgi:3-phenylpropionate/trans-cinnamate dioxygenase ferredoxin component